MPDLYVVAAQPNPPGKDAARPGVTTNTQLNEEWLEFEVRASRNLTGDELSHLTFDNRCTRTGAEPIVRFASTSVSPGQRVRVHTGTGTNQWVGSTLHVYVGRTWFMWNNVCGDRATLRYSGTVIDSAYYDRNPPEGQLVREPGTDRLVPVYARVGRW